MAELVFGSFQQMARFMKTVDRLSDAVISEGLRLAAEAIHEKMDPMFGSYQSGAGPYPDWEPLKDSTKADRLTAGFTENEPLLRTGHLRESYQVRSGLMWAGVGSEEEYALVQEVGDPTNNLPARSTLGIAFVHAEQEASEIGFLPYAAMLHFVERSEVEKKMEGIRSASIEAAIASTSRALGFDDTQQADAEARRLRHGGD